MDDELRILLENVSGRFDALSREIADASADIARYAAGTTTVAPFTVTVVPPQPAPPSPEQQPAVARARAGGVPPAGVRGAGAPCRSCRPALDALLGVRAPCAGMAGGRRDPA